jgi:RimJ/RimL family protein N-acetyltransferase
MSTPVAIMLAPDLRLRAARAEDDGALWHLAHAPGVRENAFDSSPIPLASHRRWFRDKIRSDATRIWVVEQERCLVAQVRYDRESADVAIIDFAVAPSHRGRGIGSQLLKQTWLLACNELGVARVRGVVIAGNTASTRAFANAGFREVEPVTERGQTCRVFELRRDSLEDTSAR